MLERSEIFELLEAIPIVQFAGFLVSMWFFLNYWRALAELMDEIESLEAPEQGRPYWRIKTKAYEKSRLDLFKNSVVASGLLSWNITTFTPLYVFDQSLYAPVQNNPMVLIFTFCVFQLSSLTLFVEGKMIDFFRFPLAVTIVLMLFYWGFAMFFAPMLYLTDSIF